jgi:hypothetical protein
MRPHLSCLDYVYVLSAAVAGVWPWWCHWYLRDNMLSTIAIGIPFALITFAYTYLRGALRAGEPLSLIAAAVLWMGMPLCVIVAVFAMFAEDEVVSMFGPQRRHLALDLLTLGTGEVVACLLWTTLLFLWCRPLRVALSRKRFFAVSAALFAGLALVDGIAYLAPRVTYHEMSALLLSIITTTISAFSLIVLQKDARVWEPRPAT